MIGNLEAWRKLIRDRGQTVREGMLLPIDHLCAEKRHSSLGGLAGGRQPVAATPRAPSPMRRTRPDEPIPFAGGAIHSSLTNK
jgi:hypothetical protein